MVKNRQKCANLIKVWPQTKTEFLKKAVFHKAHSLECPVSIIAFFKRWSTFVEDWDRKSPKERAAERDALNTETMLTKAQEMTEDNVTDLEVCDFFIAR